MKNYYRILGLQAGASDQEIKKAYRKLAMRYHPDRNDEPRAAQAFILVNEAYEFLSDKDRRKTYASPKTGRERDEAIRRKRSEDWEKYQKKAARRRAQAYAQGRVEDFEKSKIFRAAAMMDSVYNYVFIIIGVLIAVMPIIGALRMTEEEKAKFNYFTLIIPVILGVVFVYGIWYFVFKLGGEED